MFRALPETRARSLPVSLVALLVPWFLSILGFSPLVDARQE